MQMSYWRFAAMIATSTVVMFGLMYLNTYALDHVLWSETRAWMALLMGATMAIIMLGYMLNMYSNRKVNIAIFAGSAVVFGLSLWLIRSQATVTGLDYMKAMVPHHSIAVLTSSRAQIIDPRVRKIADEVIASQRREIAEMKYLIEQLQSGEHDSGPVGQSDSESRVVPAAEAIGTANLAMTDLEELDRSEVERVLGRGPRCDFSYSRQAGPVLAATLPADASGAAMGVVKLHGLLVEAAVQHAGATASAGTGLTLSADGMRVVVAPQADGETGDDGNAVREASANLQLDAGLNVGYGGFYRCDGAGNAG